MNHTYAVVWNVNRGGWQVASELTRSQTKGVTAGRRKSMRPVIRAGMVLTALSLNLCSPIAHADNLLVGTGGAGGGNGGTGGINGGGGGPAFYLAGGGGGGITGTTQTVAGPTDSASVGTAFDSVVIGGGGGGGSGFGGTNGVTGGVGQFTVNSTFNVANRLVIGGSGGGGGAGNSFSDRGGNGGTGGSGTLTVTGGSAVTVGGQVIIGGLGGGGGACGCSGNGGGGGAGVFNLGDGSSLNLSTASFTINGNGTLNIGNETANGATAGVITGLAAGIVNNGTISFNQSDASYTFGTVITGIGTVTQNGSGTTVLTGVNTYSGGTTINAGLINFSDGNNLGTGNITLNGGGLQWATGNTTDISGRLNAFGASGGTLDTNGNDVTLASAIGGTGGLTKTGSGVLTLTGVNAYQGTTTISGGTLALTGAGSIASSNGVTDNGLFDISGTTAGASIKSLSGAGAVALGANTLTLTDASGSFGGSIAGTGGLVVQGSGTMSLSGVNTYTGSTAISSGTLALSGAGSIAGSNELVDNGTFDISATTAGASIRNLSGAGVAALGAKTLTLTDASGTFNGSLAGTGSFVKQGGGLLVLNGNSAAFAGTTNVAGGTLEVGDVDTPAAALGGNVSVASAGRLGGHGTVSGNVSNGGTVAPGGSIGTLSIGGNYVQSGTATLAIEVSPVAASQLKVNGSATLNGVLAITYDPGTYTAKTYTLVSAANGVSGTFSSITSVGASNLGTLAPSVGYGAEAVELALSESPTAPTAPAAPPLVVAPIDTSIYAAVGTTAVLGAHAQGAALLDRLDQASRVASTTPFGWVTATGTHTNVGGTSGEPGFQSNRYGFLAGLERKYAAYTAGVAFGYDHADIGESETGDSGTTDTLRAAFYGSRSAGPVNLGATLGAGLDFLSQKRPLGPAGTAQGDHMGQEFNVGGQASLPMTFGDVKVTPRIGMRYAYFHANSFSESGAGGQNLNVGSDSVRSLQPYVGVSVERAFGDALKPVNAELHIGYAHELLDANRALSVASQDGTVFVAPGTSLPRGYMTAGANVTLHPAKNLDVSAGFDAVINTTHVSAQQGSLRVGYRF